MIGRETAAEVALGLTTPSSWPQSHTIRRDGIWRLHLGQIFDQGFFTARFSSVVALALRAAAGFGIGACSPRIADAFRRASTKVYGTRANGLGAKGNHRYRLSLTHARAS